VQNVRGTLAVTNAGGSTAVSVDDSADNGMRTVIVYNNGVANGSSTVISGLNPLGGDIVLQGRDLSSLLIQAGGGGNIFRIHDTPTRGTPGDVTTTVSTGGGSDTVTVDGTTGVLALDVQGGFTNNVFVGSVNGSLDRIHGPITITASGVTNALTFNDQGTTTPQNYNLESDRLTRRDATSVADMAPISFAGLEAVALNVTSGGGIVFVDSTSAGTPVTVNGQPGAVDTFAVGFGTDTSKILGPVSFFGQAADNDFAYYYDYLNPSPQTYTGSTTPAIPQRLLLESTDAAPVAFDGLSQVIFYLPLVGGSAVNVTGVPAQTFLNMAVSGDAVTLGSLAPNLGGTLADIKGPVAVGSYSPDNATALVLDDSGNADRTPKTVSLTPPVVDFDYGNHVEGFAPASVYWSLGANASVALRGGAADESFALTSTSFAAAISIDGGGGVNTLDYSTLADGVVVNLPLHTATALAGGIANIQNVMGSAGNDILVGNGGNLLDGGLGRDLLIAGAFASILNGGEDEDLLIGGTTNYDADPAALSAILAEWTSASGYATRVANLENGRNGAPILNADTVRSNGGGNTLSGSAGLDFFFANVDLDTLDRDPLTEALVSI
jgi:hypothetical protein